MPRALEVCGKEVTVEQVLREVEKDRAFYGSTGGMTLSGGEPMGQPDFALALLEGAKKQGVTTCIETCGAFPSRYPVSYTHLLSEEYPPANVPILDVPARDAHLPHGLGKKCVRLCLLGSLRR